MTILGARRTLIGLILMSTLRGHHEGQLQKQAFPDLHTGTALSAAGTNRFLAFAADSWVEIAQPDQVGQRGEIRNDECKLAFVKDSYILGGEGFQPVGFLQRAVSALDDIKEEDVPIALDKLMHSEGERLRAFFSYRKDIYNSIPADQRGLSLLVGTLGKDGSHVWTAKIHVLSTGDDKLESPVTLEEAHPPDSKGLWTYTVGYGANVSNEIGQSQTERGKAAKLQLDGYLQKTTVQGAVKMLRWYEGLAVDWYPGHVANPIDIAILTPQGIDKSLVKPPCK